MDIQSAIRLFKEGQSYLQIAQTLGPCRNTIVRNLQKLGYYHPVHPNTVAANRSRAEKRRRPLCTCQHCGKEYWPKAPDRLFYCGRPCFFAARAAKATAERPIHEAKRLEELEAKRLEREARRKVCAICGMEFKPVPSTATHCSRECRLEHGRQKERERGLSQWQPRSAKCKECGVVFETEYRQGHSQRVFCSPLCSHRCGSRVGKAQRRARAKGNGREAFDPFEVFTMYRWRCALCGAHTPRKLRGTLGPHAPELDHIISLADGGSHTRSNAQLLCRQCNQKKSSESVGQLVLIW